MDLSKYDGKHVRVTDKWGETFTGMAEYGNHDFLECEYGGEEDGIFIEDSLIYHSQIVSIEEIEVHGTAELWTERMILRRYRPEDAEDLPRQGLERRLRSIVPQQRERGFPDIFGREHHERR